MPTPPSSSSTVDLTSSGNFGYAGDAVFAAEQVNSGTGAFPAFLSLSNSGTEHGYNSDFRPVQPGFHATSNANHNHSLLLANIPIVEGDGTGGTIEGVLYREFLLDTNEGGGGDNHFISLDELQIWQEQSGNLTGFISNVGFTGGVNYLAYDLDASGDSWIAIDSDLSSGSGKSDVRVLIPESAFNPSVPFVYIYSAFGLTGGSWASNNGNEEWAVRGGRIGPGGGTRAALNISKSASVDGGTADSAGEIISYSFTLANTGNVNLTGIAVSDPTVTVTRGLDQVGNNDTILNVGEIWTYSAQYVVTQNDIDEAAIGGEGFITNTVSAGSDQTGHLPEQRDTASASIPIEARPLAELVKAFSSITSTDEAVGTTEADAAGDVIHYIVSVSWAPNGNTTLSGAVVTDPSVNTNPVLDPTAPVPNPNAQIFAQLTDGDFNLGDDNNNGVVDPTDQNGARDPGETFQYVYIGDTNQDGFLDPGETWAYPAYNLGDTNNDGVHQVGETWVGDANQNGVQEEGEKWQFKNLWDLNSNGLQDNDEIWHYQNVGDLDQNEVEDPGETFAHYNAGDTNQNGNEDPGEAFQFYNVGDTDRDGVEDEGETFQFDTVLPGLDVNNDNVNDGDVNADGRINETEAWQFTASYIVTQDDIDNRIEGIPTVVEGLTHDNTASVITNENAAADGSESVPIDQNPAFSIEKTVTDVGDDGPLGHVDEAGDVIRYSIVITNTGNMTLTGVTLSDPLLTGDNGTLSAAVESGDADGELDVGETWTYTGTYEAQQSDINNNGGEPIGEEGFVDNTATASTTQQPTELSSSAAVPIDRNPDYSIAKSVMDVGGDGQDGHVDEAGDVITYEIVVTNLGNVDLTGTSVSDPLLTAPNGVLSAADGDDIDPGILNVGEIWTYTGTYTAQQSDIDSRPGGGTIDNTATVQSDELADETSSAAVTVDYNPSFTFTVRTLGYHDDNPTNNEPDAGEIIDFSAFITNTGNVTLTELGISSDEGFITWSSAITLAPGDDATMDGTHTIVEGETGFEETEIGQSLEFGNVLVPVSVDFAQITPLQQGMWMP